MTCQLKVQLLTHRQQRSQVLATGRCGTMGMQKVYTAEEDILCKQLLQGCMQVSNKYLRSSKMHAKHRQDHLYQEWLLFTLAGGKQMQ